jgi:biotin transport system ATP-binding protein
MIEILSVSHRFGDRTVLKDLSLTLSERRVAVIGSNGSGKSTFARLLNGLQIPTSGQVRVDGIDTGRDGKAIRRKVGFVFQNPDNQIVFPIVEEDLAFGLKNLKFEKSEIAARVDRLLELYGLAHLRRHPAHLLSGGEKQLLAISSVLVMEPEYVVFDEPTTSLDLRNKRKIARFIRDLPQVAVVVSHDLELLGDFDRVLAFESGEVVLDGPPGAVIPAYEEMMA